MPLPFVVTSSTFVSVCKSKHWWIINLPNCYGIGNDNNITLMLCFTEKGLVKQCGNGDSDHYLLPFGYPSSNRLSADEEIYCNIDESKR